MIHEQPLPAQKVTVWMDAKSIGPYFFEDVDGATVTVKGDNYRQMIQEYLLPRLEHLDMQNLWFQHTPDTARETMAILRAAFPGRLVSRFGDVRSFHGHYGLLV